MNEEVKLSQSPAELTEDQQSVPVITSEDKPKEKDPKRVAAGKRLAAISKEAKEAKRRKQQEEEDASKSSLSTYTIIAVGISVIGYASYKYFFGRQKQEVKAPEKKVVTPEEKKEVRGGKPISMFD